MMSFIRELVKKVLRREIINNILQEIILVGLLCVNH